MDIVKKEFLLGYDDFKNKVISLLRDTYDVPEVLVKRTEYLVEYNSLGGKYLRGIFVSRTAQHFAEIWTDSIQNDAIFLGWCIEALQGAYLLADDIMDQSQLRRGKTCWYLLPEIKMSGVNDGFLLSDIVSVLIGKHIKPERISQDCQKLFQDVKLRTEIGQSLDMLTQDTKNECIRTELFTFDYYLSVVSMKTAYYTIYLSVMVGLTLVLPQSVLNDLVFMEAVRGCSVELGVLFQVQDDFLDYFSDSLHTGKNGRDIEEGKCSWIVVNVLSICTEEEKDIIFANYGKVDASNSKIVGGIYQKYSSRIRQMFSEYENSACQKILSIIDSLSGSNDLRDKLHRLFEEYIGVIAGRSF